jgi:flagellar protein FlbD
MIQLTRLNGNPLVVNSDLIKYAESSPDTVLTLTNGEKIIVRESCDEVVSRTLAWRAQLAREAAREPGQPFHSTATASASSLPPVTAGVKA